MFDFFKYALKMHKTNKQRKKRISFLFKGGYYIFFKDKICRFTFKNMKMIGFFKSLFFVYHISDQGVKKEYLIDANVKTGTMKHAVITDSKCYLVFKEQKQYLRFKKNYSENIGHFNYPIIAPTSYDDDLLYVTEPFAKGRPLTKEEIPQLLRFLLKLFADQPFVTRDDNDIIYYIQHSDPLPGNSLIDDNGNIIFIDLDSITSRPALSDFFNIIFRTQKKEVIFNFHYIYYLKH